MAEVRATVNEDLEEKLEKILDILGLYNNEAEYVREAVRKQMKEDAKLIQNMDLNDL